MLGDPQLPPWPSQLMPLADALSALHSALQRAGADVHPLPVQELRNLLILEDRRFDKRVNPRAGAPRLISNLLTYAENVGLVLLQGQYPTLYIASTAAPVAKSARSDGHPSQDRRGPGGKAVDTGVAAPAGSLPLPNWLALELEAPGDALLSATANWVGGDGSPARSTSLDVSLAWQHFVDGHYSLAKDALAGLRLAMAEAEWLPRSTADGLRFWHWTRLVHELANLESGRVSDRRRSAVSAFELALRCLPSTDPLCHWTRSQALGDFGAGDSVAMRAWAVYAARAAKVAGHELAFEEYENDERAQLRAAWTSQFAKQLSAERSTHDMATSLSAALQLKEREFGNLHRDGGQPSSWTHLLRLSRSLIDFLDVGEEALIREVMEAVSAAGRAVDSGTNSARELHDLIDSLSGVAQALAQSNSLLLQDLVSPNLQEVRLQVMYLLQQLGDSSRPEVFARLENPRLPFSARQGMDYSVQIRLSNTGNATAETVRVSVRAPEVNLNATESFEELRPGAEMTVEIPGQACESAINAVGIRCVVTWNNAMEQPFQWSGVLLAENERQANWLPADTNPFSLGTISDPDRLVGREDDLATLEALIAGGGSAYVTGQKRVGKTSLVRVLIGRLRSEREWPGSILPLGRALGTHQTAMELVLALLDEIRQAIEDLSPSLGRALDDPFQATGGNFARHGHRWLRSVARALPADVHIVIAIDDFDELPPQLVTGQEADSLFLFLRSLVDEPWLNLMVVGSEVLPSIVQAQEHKLNQVVPYSVTNFQSRESTQALLVTPTTERLEWSDEAVDAVHSLCRGNPYYGTLLGAQVWQHLRESSRAYVTASDIDSASAKICSTAPASHFVHLWADNPGGMDRNSRDAVIGSAVLRAVARCGGSGLAPAPLSEILTVAQGWVPAVPSSDIEKAVRLLDARGVLLQAPLGEAYQVSVPLAARWLQGRGAAVLDQNYSTSVYAKAKAYVVTGMDLTALSRGLVYGGEHVSEIRIRAWLDQFGSGDQQYFAYLMLKRMVEDGYFTTTRMHEQLLPRLRDQVLTSGAARSIVRDNNRYMRNGYMLKHGRAGDSTQGATSAIGKQLHIKKANVLAPEELASTVTSRPGTSVVMLLDDFSGSGTHLRSVLHHFMELLEQERQDWQELVEIVVGAAVVAKGVGVPSLSADQNSVHYVAGMVLSDRFKPFNPAAGLFANGGDRAAAEDLMTAIGRSLLPSNPLGYGGEAVLALLEFNCPNTAAPIFWKDGVYGGNPWHALFPRRF